MIMANSLFETPAGPTVHRAFRGGVMQKGAENLSGFMAVIVRHEKKKCRDYAHTSNSSGMRCDWLHSARWA
jgi:hypothetical protein